MYESPINLIVTDIYNQIQKQQEEGVYKAVLHYVPDVDKAELIRALSYDRGQYDKGYADGKRDAMDELVRCGECEKRDKDFVSAKGTVSCPYMEAFMPPDGFCSYGERKDGDGNG